MDLIFDFSAGVYSLKPAIKNDASITAASNKILFKNFFRDQYGQLHIYEEKTKRIMRDQASAY